MSHLIVVPKMIRQHFRLLESTATFVTIILIWCANLSMELKISHPGEHFIALVTREGLLNRCVHCLLLFWNLIYVHLVIFDHVQLEDSIAEKHLIANGTSMSHCIVVLLMGLQHTELFESTATFFALQAICGA